MNLESFRDRAVFHVQPNPRESVGVWQSFVTKASLKSCSLSVLQIFSPPNNNTLQHSFQRHVQSHWLYHSAFPSYVALRRTFVSVFLEYSRAVRVFLPLADSICRSTAFNFTRILNWANTKSIVSERMQWRMSNSTFLLHLCAS
jgi:hypothetical protein